MTANCNNIVCMALTKSLFNKYILEEKMAAFNVHLVSPLGNIFLIGNPDDIEIIEIDEEYTEYILIDAGDSTRKILFKGEYSDYGILLGEAGTPNSTTGINYNDGDKDFAEFVDFETGVKGQEVSDFDKNKTLN